MTTFLIVGCGYVGERVARRLLARGERVHVTSRSSAALAELASLGASAHAVDGEDERSLAEFARLAGSLGAGLRVLFSVRATEGGVERLFAGLGPHPVRLVLLSTTSIYGAATQVDERTEPAPRDEVRRAWLEAERVAAAGSWSAMILRCAAIYGAERGVHVALREGRPGRVRNLDRVVSRVHVDDLAALIVAALASDLEGRWPVADLTPATTREVATFCESLGLPALPAEEHAGVPDDAGRSVDGRAVWRLLGVDLAYPSYRQGILAAVRAEAHRDVAHALRRR